MDNFVGEMFETDSQDFRLYFLSKDSLHFKNVIFKQSYVTLVNSLKNRTKIYRQMIMKVRILNAISRKNVMSIIDRKNFSSDSIISFLYPIQIFFPCHRIFDAELRNFSNFNEN